VVKGEGNERHVETISGGRIVNVSALGFEVAQEGDPLGRNLDSDAMSVSEFGGKIQEHIAQSGKSIGGPLYSLPDGSLKAVLGHARTPSTEPLEEDPGRPNFKRISKNKGQE
jgi:hypothetical protein